MTDDEQDGRALIAGVYRGACALAQHAGADKAEISFALMVASILVSYDARCRVPPAKLMAEQAEAADEVARAWFPEIIGARRDG